MRRVIFTALALTLVALLALGGLWWGRSDEPVEAAADAIEVAEPSPRPPGSAPSAVAAGPAEEWETGFDEAIADGRGLPALRSVERALRAMPPEEAVASILRFLESGRDQSTGLPWALGAEGRLRSSPTLRVWLLDWLGRLDPVVAAQFAQEAFAAGPQGSADEWALHLRNHAWAYPEDRALVVDQALAMLRHDAWRRSVSNGFQEAFDVFVWAGAAEVNLELARLLPRDQPQALRQPANLALERLIRYDPSTILESLRANLSMLETQPTTRAGYFALADLADETQCALLESYFLDSRVFPSERAYFLQMLPNLNLAHSRNLLSTTVGHSREDVLEKLQLSEALLLQWSQDSRFVEWAPEILEAINRIRSSY